MPWEHVYVGELLETILDKLRMVLAGSGIEAIIERLEDARAGETEAISTVAIQVKKMESRHGTKS